MDPLDTVKCLRAFVYWKFRRRITAIVYGGSFRRHHLSAQITFTPLYSRNTCPPYTFSYTMLRYPDVKGKNECGLRWVDGHCSYVLLYKKNESIYK